MNQNSKQSNRDHGFHCEDLNSLGNDAKSIRKYLTDVSEEAAAFMIRLYLECRIVLCTTLHGVISQNTRIFISNAGATSHRVEL